MAKSKYQSHVKPKLEELTAQYLAGNNDEGVASYLGIGISTFYDYQLKHIEFSEAIKKAKDHRTEKVVDTIYKRAMGYDYEEVRTDYLEEDKQGQRGKIKLSNQGGKKRVTRIKKHIPGDTTAAIFILKNQRPEQWKDRSELGLSGSIPQKLIEEEKDL